jgi:hypothetical protein
MTRARLTCIAMHGQWWPEPAAVEFIRSAGFTGRMLTFFRWGEYAIWHLAPDVKVSMDGRRETAYDGEMFSKHLQFYEGARVGVSFVQELQADYAWLPVSLPGVHALRERGWTTMFEGEQSVILAARRSEPNLPIPLVTSREASTRCFPGP